jgi:alpha-tubulin suppressor-like RCC1 family protein
VLIRECSLITEGVEKIACGSWHTLAVSSKGDLLSFGVNDNGVCLLVKTCRR